MRVALVYDRVNKWGGAERVLLALHEIWPQAPLYTAVYDPQRAPWACLFDVRASFLNNLPLARVYHELYAWLTPLAFETFNFDEYDLVISVTSAEAKGIITKPQTLHICYCLTPTRYLWSGYAQYQAKPGLDSLNRPARAILKALAPTLRRWDLIASRRPDHYLAISERVARRIKQYYRQEPAAVIYPPVDLAKFPLGRGRGKYFLVVSRLVGYKRLDLIIEAFNKLGWPLVIVGEGLARRELAKRAQGNIRLVGANLTDKELARYYQNCRAIVTAADEDFGLTAVEALATGRPVIGFAQSGTAEIVGNGRTGILFEKQTVAAIVAALTQFTKLKFDPRQLRLSVAKFAEAKFKIAMKAEIEALYRRKQKV